MIEEKDGFDDQELRRILRLRNVAVVGASRNSSKPAHYVPKYLLDHRYNVLPVNPLANEILGRESRPSLTEVDQEFNIVGIFRSSQDVLPVVRDAIGNV